MTMICKSEVVQELLDAGITRNKVAEIMGVHHTKINRLVDKHKLEIYVPFDSEDSRKHITMNFEWLWQEDELEELMYKAFDGDFTLLRSENEDTFEVGRYVRDTYGGIKSYFSRKGFKRVMSNVWLVCRCGNNVSLENWHADRSKIWGLCDCCPCCRGEFSKRYVENNPGKIFGYSLKRRKMVLALPCDFESQSWLECRSAFNYRCSLSTKLENISMDHFIPASIGHGGTYLGNMIPLLRGLNSKKRARNPFKWVEGYSEYSSNFLKVIDYLSTLNALTPQEYRNFVDWCHANPRTIDEVKADQRHSIEIWREASGHHFPLPSYTATYSTSNMSEKEAI